MVFKDNLSSLPLNLACNPDSIRNRKGYTPNSSEEKQMGSLQWAQLFYKNYERCKRQAEKFKDKP